MTAVWLSGVYNYTGNRFRLFQNDPWHRPHDRARNRTYAENEEILIRGDVDREDPEPRVYLFDNFAIPWVAPGEDRRLKVTGPGGSLTFFVGPVPDHQDHDHLRGFDTQRDEILTLPLGPRGIGNTVWLELLLREDGMLWRIQSSNGIGDVIGAKFGEYADFAAKELIKKLINMIPDAGGTGGRD